MKKILCSALIVVLILSLLTSCKSDENFMNNSDYKPDNQSNNTASDSTEINFSKGDAEIVKLVSKDAFTKDIQCEYNDKKITVSAPKFTCLPISAVYSYKQTYDFIDGTTFFSAKTAKDSISFLVDKNGTTVTKSTDADYEKITKDRDKNTGKYFRSEEIEIKPGLEGSIIGNNVAKAQFGEPGNYTQYLYNTAGERISAGYDGIGYFYDGLALIIKDKKVGIIDEAGKEVLAPCIEFDTIIYPPTEREFEPCYMTEDAFVLPIGGEFAIINIKR